MGLSRSLMRPSRALFHGIVPGAAATLVGNISLPVTFEARKNFHMKIIQFEVIDFETVYNAFFDTIQVHGFCIMPTCSWSCQGRVASSPSGRLQAGFWPRQRELRDDWQTVGVHISFSPIDFKITKLGIWIERELVVLFGCNWFQDLCNWFAVQNMHHVLLLLYAMMCSYLELNNSVTLLIMKLV
jgi:hypothetical protein